MESVVDEDEEEEEGEEEDSPKGTDGRPRGDEG